jgi:hypothetical protein
MQTSELERFATTSESGDEVDFATPQSPEDLVDQLGIKIALLVLFAALVLAAIWVLSTPSFQKCIALENATQRDACYSELRNELLKPPAKGLQGARST